MSGGAWGNRKVEITWWIPKATSRESEGLIKEINIILSSFGDEFTISHI